MEIDEISLYVDAYNLIKITVDLGDRYKNSDEQIGYIKLSLVDILCPATLCLPILNRDIEPYSNFIPLLKCLMRPLNYIIYELRFPVLQPILVF